MRQNAVLCGNGLVDICCIFQDDGLSSDSNDVSIPISPQECVTALKYPASRSRDTMNQSDNSQQNRVYENMRNHSLEAGKDHRKVSHYSCSASYQDNKESDTRSTSSYSISRPESELGASRSDSEAIYAVPNKRPSSSIIEALQIEQELFGLDSPVPDKESFGDGMDSPVSDSKSEGIDIDISGNISEDSMEDPLYQEVDQNHESTYEPKRSMPPQIKIERKLFQDINKMDSFVSSSNDSEELLERNQKFLTGTDKPTMTVEPISRHLTFEDENHYASINVSTLVQSPRSPRSPRSPYSPHTPFLPLSSQLPDLVTPPVMMEQQSSNYFMSNSSSNTASAIATLPRRRGDRNKPVFQGEESAVSHSTSPSQSELVNQLVSVEVHNAPATVPHQLQRLKPTTPKPARARFNTWVSLVI